MQGALRHLKRASMELQVGPKWFQVTADPITDSKGEFRGAVHIVRDISEYKQIERDLRESEEKYRHMFENGSDLLCIHDLTGRLVETNLSYKRHYGLKDDRLLGLNIRDFIPDRYESDLYLRQPGHQNHDGLYAQGVDRCSIAFCP